MISCPRQVPSPEAAPLRRSLAGRYLWLIGLALYIVIVWYIGWQRISSALRGLNVVFLFALIVLESATVWFRAFKWRFALGQRNHAVALYFVSKAAGGMSPGRVGELAPLLLKGHRTPRLGAWIVFDRLIEIAATLGLGLLGLIVLRVPHRGAIVILCILFLLVLVIGPLFILTRHRWFASLAARCNEASLTYRVMRFLADVSAESLQLRHLMPAVSAMTLLATASDIVVSILLYQALGYSVGFMVLAVVQSAHGIISAIPFTPNATGVPYLIAADIIHELTPVPWEVLAVSVILRTACTNAVFWTSFGIGAATFKKRITAENKGNGDTGNGTSFIG